MFSYRPLIHLTLAAGTVMEALELAWREWDAP